MIFCCNDDGNPLYTQAYKRNGKYEVNISDCVDGDFDYLNTALKFAFDYISRVITEDADKYTENILEYLNGDYEHFINNPISTSALLTTNKKYITQDFIDAAEYHHLVFCNYCIIDMKRHEVPSTWRETYIKEILFILKRSLQKRLNDLLREYGVQFNVYQQHNTSCQGRITKVNGTLSSKKEITCFHILSLMYPDLEQQVSIPETRRTVDYYSPSYNLIIEFLGDFYHGNLDKYDGDTMNPKVKKT